MMSDLWRDPEAFDEEWLERQELMANVADAGDMGEDEDEGDTPTGIEDDCPLDGDAESTFNSIGWGDDNYYTGCSDGGDEW
jgi:hypothetical protein